MSTNKIIAELDAEQMGREVPAFAPGDTVVVQVRVKEGNRERCRHSVCIGKRNRGLNSAFTVRKISHGVGVDIQTYSPLVDSINVKRRGDGDRLSFTTSGLSLKLRGSENSPPDRYEVRFRARRFFHCCKSNALPSGWRWLLYVQPGEFQAVRSLSEESGRPFAWEIPLWRVASGCWILCVRCGSPSPKRLKTESEPPERLCRATRWYRICSDPAPGIEVQVVVDRVCNRGWRLFFSEWRSASVRCNRRGEPDGRATLIARKEQLAAVSLEDMVVFSPKGETRDYVSVFTDVTCFYCQKLHREVDQLNAKGVEVRYLAFPRGGINSDGAKKLATAWCADDQQTTLTELKAGVDLPVTTRQPDWQYQLGQRVYRVLRR